MGKPPVGRLTGAMLIARHAEARSPGASRTTLDKLRARSARRRQRDRRVRRRARPYRAQLPAVLRLIVEVLREPSFPADELETLKRAAR